MRRLREVEKTERQRRAVSASSGGVINGCSRGDVGSSGVTGIGIGRRATGREELAEDKVSPDVRAMVLELRKVAMRGDATTLDMLLSSQVRSATRFCHVLPPIPPPPPFSASYISFRYKHEY